jgi:hypothetical protein
MRIREATWMFSPPRSKVAPCELPIMIRYPRPDSLTAPRMCQLPMQHKRKAPTDPKPFQRSGILGST